MEFRFCSLQSKSKLGASILTTEFAMETYNKIKINIQKRVKLIVFGSKTVYSVASDNDYAKLKSLNNKISLFL